LHEVYALAPEIAISELWFDHFPTKGETRYPTIDVLHTLCTAENIEQAHARGQRVTCWTVNEVEDMRRLMADGIDGIATDYPQRLMDLL
jgi:glycerophosphoryl diester phosphodiesterase